MNRLQSNPAMNHRRDFLRGCLRGGGLLALGTVATALGWRSMHGRCQRANPCGDCPEFTGCELPKARDAKSNHPTRSSHV